MTTEIYQIAVAGMNVEVVRKPIKNLHFGVYPPHGRVRVAAPLALTRDAVRLAVVDKLSWINRQRAKFEAQPRQSHREMVSGESHYFLGRSYLLAVIEDTDGDKVVLQNKVMIHLYVRPGSTQVQREQLLRSWYRAQLSDLIPSLIEKWQSILKVKASSWGIRRMKTKWGSCSPSTGRILLNLELAKKPVPCLEYIVLHELLHLLERKHNDRFVALMDRHMPNWTQYRDELNASHLGHEVWNY